LDLEQARFNMVQQQIRPWEVLDQDILDLLFQVKREEFAPEAYRKLAFADIEIPLGFGEVMLAPKMEARMLQTLEIEPSHRILEVGTGSGYMTALLAKRGAHVYSVEIVPELHEFGGANLALHGLGNVTLEMGDAARGWAEPGPYDVIVLTGSTPLLPQGFLDSLNPGGRLFAVVGDPPVMAATLVTCVAPGAYRELKLFETCIPPLRNAQQPARFRF
jgi:protein-L-isoaspartate(D-aspartate) O-methyltransferase